MLGFKPWGWRSGTILGTRPKRSPSGAERQGAERQDAEMGVAGWRLTRLPRACLAATNASPRTCLAATNASPRACLAAANASPRTWGRRESRVPPLLPDLSGGGRFREALLRRSTPRPPPGLPPRDAPLAHGRRQRWRGRAVCPSTFPRTHG